MPTEKLKGVPLLPPSHILLWVLLDTQFYFFYTYPIRKRVLINIDGTICRMISITEMEMLTAGREVLAFFFETR
jgi:hypothetical protein